MTRSLGSDDGISGVHVSPTVPVEFLLEVHRPQGGAGHIAYHFETLPDLEIEFVLSSNEPRFSIIPMRS